MKKHYILIDYENVQTKSLAVLQGAPNQAFRIMVFVGANQSKIPIDLVSSMQGFGDKAEYIQITGSGRNALDFHIAYYLGALTERDPAGIFHVISKDTGYDQLIRHLKGKRSLRRGRRTCSTSRGCRRPTRNPQTSSSPQSSKTCPPGAIPGRAR